MFGITINTESGPVDSLFGRDQLTNIGGASGFSQEGGDDNYCIGATAESGLSECDSLFSNNTDTMTENWWDAISDDSDDVGGSEPEEEDRSDTYEDWERLYQQVKEVQQADQDRKVMEDTSRKSTSEQPLILPPPPVAHPSRNGTVVATPDEVLSGTEVEACGGLNFSNFMTKSSHALFQNRLLNGKTPEEDSSESKLNSSSESEEISWSWEAGAPPPLPNLNGELEDVVMNAYNELESILKPNESARRDEEEEIGKLGPGKLWYEMMDETGDYDMEKDECSSVSSRPQEVNFGAESSIPEDAFEMVTQMDWETDVLWDSSILPEKNIKPLSTWTSNSSRYYIPGMKQATGAVPSTCGLPDASSVFPIENPELVHKRWEDYVIWDAENVNGNQLCPKILTLDPNDDNIVLTMPKDACPLGGETEAVTPPPKPKSEKYPHANKSKRLLDKVGLIRRTNAIPVEADEEGNDHSKKDDKGKDPYNISNDEFYEPQPKRRKRNEVAISNIEANNTPLQHATPVSELRVPFIPTKIVRGGYPEGLNNLHRPLWKPEVGKSPVQIMSLTPYIQRKAAQRKFVNNLYLRTAQDLSGKDGELLLVENSEEHPPLLSQVGMCSKIKNYYRRKLGTNPQVLKYGEATPVTLVSPFLGQLQPGEMLPTLENNMYRAPIYPHKTATDFLLIPSKIRGKPHFIREIDGIFTAGQQITLQEVPSPTSQVAISFLGKLLQVVIYRLFSQSQENLPRIAMRDIRSAFPGVGGSSIRDKLTTCADYLPNSSLWVLKPGFRLPTEEEIRGMLSPEECCAYFSLLAARQRLEEAGFGGKKGEDSCQEKTDEINAAPWNTTRACLQAMSGSGILDLNGSADPTGCGEGFSYVHVPILKSDPNAFYRKYQVGGTDADLRRMSVESAKSILRGFGCLSEEEIGKLTRWELIDTIRMACSEKRNEGEGTKLKKFSRKIRPYAAEMKETYREECQRIFDLQNKVLGSSEVWRSDDSDEDDEELNEMGRKVEALLNDEHETKEEEERCELLKMLHEKKEKEEGKKAQVLKITRTNKQGCTTTEIVRNPAVINAYLKASEETVKQKPPLDDETKQELIKEKRSLQEQLRRIQRNEEKANFGETNGKPKKKKQQMKPGLTMTCGRCGSKGHMKSNRGCPQFPKIGAPLPYLVVKQEEGDGVIRIAGLKREPFVLDAPLFDEAREGCFQKMNMRDPQPQAWQPYPVFFNGICPVKIKEEPL